MGAEDHKIKYVTEYVTEYSILRILNFEILEHAWTGKSMETPSPQIHACVLRDDDAAVHIVELDKARVIDGDGVELPYLGKHGEKVSDHDNIN